MEGQPNQLQADGIIKVIGNRILQRSRDRKDMNQAAARIVRESTENVIKTGSRPSVNRVDKTGRQ